MLHTTQLTSDHWPVCVPLYLSWNKPMCYFKPWLCLNRATESTTKNLYFAFIITIISTEAPRKVLILYSMPVLAQWINTLHMCGWQSDIEWTRKCFPDIPEDILWWFEFQALLKSAPSVLIKAYFYNLVFHQQWSCTKLWTAFQ